MLYGAINTLFGLFVKQYIRQRMGIVDRGEFNHAYDWIKIYNVICGVNEVVMHFTVGIHTHTSSIYRSLISSMFCSRKKTTFNVLMFAIFSLRV